MLDPAGPVLDKAFFAQQAEQLRSEIAALPKDANVPIAHFMRWLCEEYAAGKTGHPLNVNLLPGLHERLVAMRATPTPV